MSNRVTGGFYNYNYTQQKPPTKVSVGIILCRKNENGKPEVLLAHKRYTYAFADFIHGRYVRSRNGPEYTLSSIASLFNQMTCEELLDIYSLRFDQMWYRIWLTLENKDLYNRKYAKFQSTFIRDDGGATLKKFIMQARSIGTLLWEVPKGRRQNNKESDLVCAIREFNEETGIEKNKYKFFPGIKRKISYISSGTRYICSYYAALATSYCSTVSGSATSKPTLSKVNTMGEISEIRWFDIEKIRLIDVPGKHLEALVKPVFKIMNQYLKGRWVLRKNRDPLPLIEMTFQ